MPLVESALKQGLKSKIETKLKTEFKKESTKEALRVSIDGGDYGGRKTDAKTWAKALGNIKDKTSQILDYTPDLPGSSELSSKLVNAVAPNEFANAVSDSICEWMSDTVAPILAEELSDIIANEVTKYIKSATIIVKPGIAVATAGSPAAQTGATTAPSAPATIA
jgi:hypothetical protein